MVFIHGYAGFGATFYTMMKDMAQHFELYFLDIMGMGGSSTPTDFDIKADPRVQLDYFVDYIERWRLEIGVTESFVMVGHSFGGYLAGQYTIKYP
jgi:pimeloyl-ACP methyl ester carboxylesterase